MSLRKELDLGPPPQHIMDGISAIIERQMKASRLAGYTHATIKLEQALNGRRTDAIYRVDPSTVAVLNRLILDLEDGKLL